MQEKQKINIVWFKNDLRTKDQISLFKAYQGDLPFIALYIFDEDFYIKKQFGFRKIGKFRAKFLLESVQNLQHNLAELNIPFLIKFGKTKEIFEKLNEHYSIQKIFCEEEFTQEEVDLEKNVSSVLSNVKFEKSYSQFLLEPDFVFKKLEKIPALFTTFRNKVEKNFSVRKPLKIEKRKVFFELEIPSDKIDLEKLGFEKFETHPYSAFPFSGGENAAWERLHYYFEETQLLKDYKNTRNGLLGSDYSSKFSAWLANGSISAVCIYDEVKKFEQKFGANESTYWLIFELLWRDYFKFIALQHRNEIFHKNGLQPYKNVEFQNNPQKLEQLISGKTHSEFVNANMIELQKTGFMSNRGRQNVASYFCKNLKLDWRIGAAYFEEMLIDYDVHSNYGNWLYLAGIGNDARDRSFNTEKQAEQYDSDKKFRNLWLKTH
ncbi:DASH family cryptochrome [Cloacibacterium normanense]|uniref:DASH family cryptochrome n=1 Tax=Cloacibacterium normanense TaxID=237258 RepID=UPI00352CEFDA